MNFLSLKNLGENARSLGSWVARKGWRESFARGDDLSGLGGDRGGCPNPAQFSTWVFRCLQLIAGQVRSQPLKFSTLNSAGKKTDWTDPETLAFWKQPAETASGPISFGDFIELTLDWINLKGQACWVLDDTWLTPRGKKSPVLLARPDRLSPVKRGDTLLGWMFTDGIGGRHVLTPQQVIRPRFLNPYDDAEGLAPLDAARIAVDADYASSVFARNVAMSNGDQGVYIIAKGGGALSEEQRSQIIAQLRQKAMLSRRGEYRPAFLTADVAIEDPKLKTVDAAFNEGRMESRHEIYVAFGVPPSMAEVTASYSIGSASDRYRLLEETGIPHSRRLCEAIALVERLRSGRVLEVEQDWSDHPTMAQVRIERAKSAADMFKAGVPWSVLNQMYDLNMTKFPGWDASWLPMNLERVEETKPNKADEDEAQADSQDPANDPKKTLAASSLAIQEIRKLITSGALQREAPATLPIQAPAKGKGGGGCGCAKAEGDEEHTADPKRLKLWNLHMKLRTPSERLFTSKVRRVLMKARAETLSNLEATDKALEGARQRGVLDVLFDLSSFTISMVEQTGAAHRETLTQSLMQFAEEIGSDDPWSMESEVTLNFLRKRENRIRDCSRDIHESIKAELETGLSAGETNKQLADRVRSAFNDLSKDRAEMIAATEVTAAYGYARHDAMQGLGIGNKEWLSAQDGRVRDTHMRADGQTVGMDEPFIVELKEGGSEELMYPGDANGSAENVIRCRCVSIAKMETEDA